MEAAAEGMLRTNCGCEADDVDARYVLDSLPFQFTLTRPDGRLAYANRAWLAARGLSTSDVIGKREQDLIQQRTDPSPADHSSSAEKIGAEVKRHGPPEGDSIPGWSQRWPLCDAIGNVELNACLSTDIASARRELERYELAIDGSKHGLWHRDLRTNEMWFSANWKRTLELSESDITADRASFLSQIHPEDRDLIDTEMSRHLSGETETYECEFRMFHKDGSLRWIRSRGAAIQRNGVPIAIAGSHEDVTDHKNLEKFYLQLLDAFPGMVWVKNEQLKFEFVNEKIAEAYGTTREAAIGKGDDDLNPNKEQVEMFHADDQKVFQKEIVLRREEVLTDCKGRDHDLEVVKVLLPPMPRWKGKGKLVLGFGRDISDVKETREELEKERETLRNLMDNVLDGIFFKDREGRFVRANRALARLGGFDSGDDLIGKTDLDLIGDIDYDQAAKKEEAELFRTGQPVTNVRRTPTKNGMRWLSITKVPIHDAEGVNIVQLCGISKDITNLMESQEELRERREELDGILNTLPQCIFVKDRDGRYIRCNKAFADRHREPNPEAVIGKTDFDYWDKKKAEEFRSRDQEVLRANVQKRFSETQPGQDGSTRLLETLKLPLHDESGQPVKILGIYEDVTERIGDEKLKFNKEVARTIGHCLKNWMSVIAGNIATLEERHESLQHNEAFTRLKKASEYLLHATRIATRIATLDVARHYELCDVNDIVRSVVRTLGDPRITFEPSTGHPKCLSPAGHFPNVILEMLANARHYAQLGERGLIKVRIEERRNRCLIHFADNGPGVPDSLRDKVFEFFTAGDPSGTGMGLGYAKWVCGACKGTIRLLPKASAIALLDGAHFIIDLPIEAASELDGGMPPAGAR